MSSLKGKLIRTVGKLYEPLTKSFVKKQYKRNLPVTEPEEAKVLVLAPHVDDETIGAGGTILKHLHQGAEVTVLYLTDGSGSQGGAASDKLVQRRRNEADQIQKRFDITAIHFLDASDGHLNEAIQDERFTGRFQHIVTAVDPDIVYLPTALDCHPDHVASGGLIKYINNNPLIRLYEINTAIPADIINCVVDITPVHQAKVDALRIFTSQVIDFDGFINLASWKSGMAIGDGVKQVETFLELTSPQFLKMYDHVIHKDISFSTYFKQVNKTATLPLALGKNLNQKHAWYVEALKEENR